MENIIIDQGGTFNSSNKNTTITYSVYIKNDDGLKQLHHVKSELINGDLQDFAYGAKIVWSPGVYHTADEFAVTFQSTEVQIGSVRSGQIYR